VTNQGVIGRELATESDVMVIHALLLAALSDKGIVVDGIYACPTIRWLLPRAARL